MSRQIKFRTWDKNRQSFIGPVNLLGDQKCVVLPENWSFLNYCDVVNLSTSAKTLEEAAKQRNEYARQNWIVQQWTGLLDKNGVEIYEGDIVEYECNDPRFSRSVVRWTHEHEDNHPGFMISSSWSQYGNPTIVGNIYENQELLVN